MSSHYNDSNQIYELGRNQLSTRKSFGNSTDLQALLCGLQLYSPKEHLFKDILRRLDRNYLEVFSIFFRAINLTTPDIPQFYPSSIQIMGPLRVLYKWIAIYPEDFDPQMFSFLRIFLRACKTTDKKNKIVNPIVFKLKQQVQIASKMSINRNLISTLPDPVDVSDIVNKIFFFSTNKYRRNVWMLFVFPLTWLLSH
jgi:hypothetical protein